MSTTRNGDVQMRYALSGREDGELLVLSNSLGSSLLMWNKVLVQLEARYRILRYDTRGHGESSVPPGPYTLQQLGQDVLRLLDEIGVQHVSFCGLSLGGLIGIWLGLNAPQRLNRLVLANTGARIGSPEIWDDRIALVQQSGMESLSFSTLDRWFTPHYRELHCDEMNELQRMIASTSPDGYCACCAVLREADLRADISSIHVPTLVIAGTRDPSTPPSSGRSLAAALPGAQYVELDASHMSSWEQAHEFADAILTFPTQGAHHNGGA